MARATKLAKGRSPAPSDEIAWIPAEKDYFLGLDGQQLVCKNPAGKKLGSVPKDLKESELGEQLTALTEWLAEHRNECQHRVETWMLRSLPVPCEVVSAVWQDPDWRDMLQNLVVVQVGPDGKPTASVTGLLREVDAAKGIGIVDRDGETQWIDSQELLIPHPILIDGLAELRELATDLDFTQTIEQLYRPVFSPTREQLESDRISDFSGGNFEQLMFVMSLCRRLGYPVRGGSACARVWEGGEPIEARFWVGADAPESETTTGDLIFVDAKQNTKKISEVGRVTFSEGVFLATRIFAKRKVEKEEGKDA